MMKRLFIICGLLTALFIAGSYLPLSVRFFDSSLPLEKNILHHDDSVQWFKIKRIKKIKGVALVVHGLNLKPDRMSSMISALNDAGIDVLNLSLRGHGNNFLKNTDLPKDEARLESFQKVTYSLWLDEIYTAYQNVSQRAHKKKVPIFFVGYSLGGLMGCDLVLEKPDVFYDRMILFAPALSITVQGYLLKPLMPFPNVVIDSLSPTYYRSNKGTPMAAYKALFEARNRFNNTVNHKLNKPTLIFIDGDDEFVPFEKLKEIITQRKFDSWQIHSVRKDSGMEMDNEISHHLIIDQNSVGQGMWKIMKEAMKKHLQTDSF